MGDGKKEKKLGILATEKKTKSRGNGKQQQKRPNKQ